MIYMIILKIGGSILTNKDAAESEIDEKNLSRIAKEIKSSLDNDLATLQLKNIKLENLLTKMNILKKE